MVPNFFKRRRIGNLLKQEDLPEEIRAYLLLAEKGKIPKVPWLLERYVVIDTETTGLNPQRDQILSIGAVVVRGGEIRLGESLHLWLDIPHYSRESILIHGILPEESQSGVSPQVAVRELLQFVGNSPLVGHHLNFDLQVLEKLVAKECPRFSFFNQILDTAQLAMRLEKAAISREMINPQEYSLDALIRRYGLEANERHTALGDAFITAQLFLMLLAKGRKRGWKGLG